MSSLPTIDLEDYNTQLAINNEKIEGLLKAMFPDLNIPYEDIYQILLQLEETQVNAEVLPQIIRGLHNIMIGTGKGQVVCHVKNGVVDVLNRENNDAVEVKVL